MVFTANAGLIFENYFILASLRHPERRGESPHFEKWFKGYGYQVHTLPPDCFFEGAGDGLFLGENLFAGYRIRSDVQAHRIISEYLGKRVLSLELVDERFYHLDTCFCPLDADRALYYPLAFDEPAGKVIQQFVPKPLPVSDADALRFGCNAIVIEENVVLHYGCEELKAMLIGEGFLVHELDFSDQHSLKLLTPVMEYNIFLNHDGIAPKTQGIRITDREGFGDKLLDHLSGWRRLARMK